MICKELQGAITNCCDNFEWRHQDYELGRALNKLDELAYS